MRSKWILLVATSALAGLFGSGCAESLDGRVTPGVPFVKDTIEGRYEKPVLDVWAAAQDVLNYNGRIYSKDVMKSTLEASVNQRTVWVKVQPVDEKVTKVTVQARSKVGGDIALASEIDKQIALRLATGNLTPATHESSK
jgi:carbon monoxide dehydrogenase subunit G